MAFDPQGRWLVTSSQGYSHTAQLWDLQAVDPTQAVRVLRGYGGGIIAAAIDPQSRWLVIGRGSGARLFDLQAVDPTRTVRVLRGHEEEVTAVAIDPQGRWLVTGSKDKTARFWALRLDVLLDRARRAIGRNLTGAEWGQYFPDKPYRPTFPELPVPAGVEISGRSAGEQP